MIAGCVFVLATAIVATIAHPTPKLNSELDSHWETWKTTFGKSYDQQFEYVRRLVWESNLKYIQNHNLEHDMGKHKYALGMNHFGDMTHEEFKAAYLGFKRDLSGRRNSTQLRAAKFMPPLGKTDYPDTVDWRQHNLVTAVKNQGQCGSCWSFSSTGSIEGQYARATGTLKSFSESQLVDCSGSFGNMGCNGGLMDSAFKYVEKFGLEQESDYPYKARQRRCKYQKDLAIAHVSDFTDVESGDEEQLKQAVATVGPVSVAIDASHPSFQFYSQGVYDEVKCSSTMLDHGVLTVGYGTKNGADYWLVKNSWGPQWGDNGYIKMSRNLDNQCGIATQASYPIVSKQ